MVVPVYLAMAGAVLQFDSSDGCDGNFLNEDDFEFHLLVEYIGVLVCGSCMVSSASVAILYYLLIFMHSPHHLVAGSDTIAMAEVWWEYH